MFKTCILSIIFALIPSSGFCIDIWHSNTTWAGQGYTAYSFTLDGGDVLVDFTGGAKNVSITVDVYEDSVKKDSQVFEISQIGSCEADRHQLSYIFTNAIENKPSKFVVSKASAVIEDEPVDLLAAKRISWREFVPVQIEVVGNAGANHPASKSSNPIKDFFSNIGEKINSIRSSDSTDSTSEVKRSIIPTEECPIRIETAASDYKITAIADNVTIYGMTFNRGNADVIACYPINPFEALAALSESKLPPSRPIKFPVTLKFGEEMVFALSTPNASTDLAEALFTEYMPNIIEIDVDTDHGNWRFPFK